MRGQAEEQEASLKAQEEEVHSKKRELEVLIEEEQKLNSDIKKSQREIEQLVRSLSDVETLLEETTGKCGEYEELEKHLMEATKKFDQVLGSSDDSLAQNVPEMYLEPIRYTFSEPDFSVLDRPSKPPRPEAPSALSPMQNGRHSSSDDPFSNQSVSPAEANKLFNNEDAFAAFSKEASAVSVPLRSFPLLLFLFTFCIYLFCRRLLTLSVTLVLPGLSLGTRVHLLAISPHPARPTMTHLLHSGQVNL